MKTPQTYLVGYTQINFEGLKTYLTESNQLAFLDELEEYGYSPEALCSFYAKLCYKSLTIGKNENISKTRSIEDNIIGTIKSGHGSVFEHVCLNFLTTNCSRVFTHELVRHRVGTAFSQTSGRYCAIDESLDLVAPPEITNNEEANSLFNEFKDNVVKTARRLQQILIPSDADFATKKKLTSTIRRIAPNGQTNEIGWSCNIRSLRHMLQMRTSRHAEWEIRVVFNQVANIISEKFPMMLYGATVEEIDGLKEYSNLGI